MIIFLRPKRSATAPQKGAAIIMVMPCTEMTKPASSSVLWPPALPSDSIYSGRKGKIIEKPTADKICAMTNMPSVNFQLCGKENALVSE